MKVSVKNPALKRDILLIVLLFFAALILYAVLVLQKKEGSSAVIIVDGNVYTSGALNQNRIIDVDTELGNNRIIIDNGTVYMETADCPDKVCIRTGRISRSGETIVCLPHKVIVKVESADNQIDGEVR